MQKQIFYIYKFKSSRLKEFNYDISLTFDEAQDNKEVISLFDSQLLRSVRFLKGEEFDYDLLSELKEKRENLKLGEHSKENSKNISELQDKINKMLYVPEIINIVMESKADYKYLYKNYLKLNGRLYRRFSCSAGQARISNVIFCELETADKLDEIFNNGRDETKELVPSKYNAYKGLISSSTSVVSDAKFCVVPDYESETEVTVNFVTETGMNEDEHLEVKTLPELFNRFDGQGIISIELAKKWAKDLDLDYIPSQWCVRHNYLKGMVSTFDIKEFCRLKNNGNYMIKTSYKDKDGNNIMVDLKETDLIISESMFKLWDSWSSIEEYQDSCKNNNLQWGVSLLNPKKDKDILRMNYQFLQTLDLKDHHIESICEKFVDWIQGVNSKNIYYTMLFLLGTNVDEERILNQLENSDNHWMKSFIVNPKLIEDKWIKKKIYDLMKNKIKKGCLGQILVDGNFQVLVSDPYAQMQHICGHEKVTGLLGKNEYYSNYWNEKEVKLVDSMRAPLTYRSEHVLLDLKNTKEMKEWYKYNKSGIIVNIHGDETMRWAGSDFDMDIIATTSDKNVIEGVYRDELPVMYTPPKPKKKKLKDRDLHNADLHSFGSEIGQITNKSTSGFALLEQLEKDTEEYETLLRRIKSCTKFQSAQIDKAKIGRKVKSTPKIWQEYNYINDDDPEEEKERKQFLNKILLNKHPYFFTYLYPNTKKKYNRHFQNEDITCKQKFGIGLNELKLLENKSLEQEEFLQSFYYRSPVIDSDCVMNKICRYIESIDFNIRNVIKEESDDELYRLLMSGELINFNDNKYKKIKKALNDYKNTSSNIASNNSKEDTKEGFDEEKDSKIELGYQLLEESMIKICSNVYELVDYLVYIFYVDRKGYNKEVLWSVYGSYIFENVKSNVARFKIPVPCEDGEIEYLNKKYTIKEVTV